MTQTQMWLDQERSNFYPPGDVRRATSLPLKYTKNLVFSHLVSSVPQSLKSPRVALPPLPVCATSHAHSTVNRHHCPLPHFNTFFEFLSFHHCSFNSNSSPHTLKTFVFIQFSLNTYAVSLPPQMLLFVWFRCSRFPFCSTLSVLYIRGFQSSH